MIIDEKSPYYNPSYYFKLYCMGGESCIYKIGNNKLYKHFKEECISDLKSSFDRKEKVLQNCMNQYDFFPEVFDIAYLKQRHSSFIYGYLLKFVNALELHKCDFDFEQKCDVICEITRNIFLLLNKGYYYVDLKPSNILINHEGDIRFVDMDGMYAVDSGGMLYAHRLMEFYLEKSPYLGEKAMNYNINCLTYALFYNRWAIYDSTIPTTIFADLQYGDKKIQKFCKKMFLNPVDSVADHELLYELIKRRGRI